MNSYPHTKDTSTRAEDSRISGTGKITVPDRRIEKTQLRGQERQFYIISITPPLSPGSPAKRQICSPHGKESKGSTQLHHRPQAPGQLPQAQEAPVSPGSSPLRCQTNTAWIQLPDLLTWMQAPGLPQCQIGPYGPSLSSGFLAHLSTRLALADPTSRLSPMVSGSRFTLLPSLHTHSLSPKTKEL